jgi:type II secretory ATPase GspE/PulE/Tfp pilus assembly ATPase PilB-like protein
MTQSLEQVLVDRGLISAKQLKQAAAEAEREHEPLVRVLVREKIVAEADLLRILGEQQGIEFVIIRDLTVASPAVRSVSAKFVSHYSIMPIKLEGSLLTVAVSNPFDMSSIEDIETNLGFSVERVFACRNDIAEGIKKYYGVGSDTVERILDELGEPGEIRIEDRSQDLEKMAEDASVVKLVNQLLQEAIRDRATDIHYEIYSDGVTVRRRIDGVMYDTKVAKNIGVLYPAIVSRIKLMAGLNIVERRLPQDGRIRVTVGHSQYDLRVSVVPALHGENVVIRILPTTMLLSLEDLGLAPRHMEQLTDLSKQPHGIIMVTGPTGSGKSTTLYACLSMLNTRERKIITIEDPVEYEIRGLCQTQINPTIGLTFATALRSMLRHDPDVMMVGEVRDSETAEITIQTALTGHLVFSTLHTNDAASGPVRLIDMGVDPYLVASSVRAFTAQRLVRVICSSCKESYETENKTMYRGKGCKKCSRTGYRGRAAICEIMPMNEDIQKLVLKKVPADELRQKAIALGMTTLEQDGWDKVSQGITTAEEVLKVTSM